VRFDPWRPLTGCNYHGTRVLSVVDSHSDASRMGLWMWWVLLGCVVWVWVWVRRGLPFVGLTRAIRCEHAAAVATRPRPGPRRRAAGVRAPTKAKKPYRTVLRLCAPPPAVGLRRPVNPFPWPGIQSVRPSGPSARRERPRGRPDPPDGSPGPWEHKEGGHQRTRLPTRPSCLSGLDGGCPASSSPGMPSR
jgi:hypothetical protein